MRIVVCGWSWAETGSTDRAWKFCAYRLLPRSICFYRLGKVHNVPNRETEYYFAPPARGMGIDATFPFKGLDFPPLSIVSRELTAQVVARWKEYGLP